MQQVRPVALLSGHAERHRPIAHLVPDETAIDGNLDPLDPRTTARVRPT